MNTRTLTGLAMALALGASGGAFAQVPSGGSGSDAKGNAPVKHAHTVNDGGARRGHNSFTEAQARRHIVHAGYTAVTGLTKGDDGVWRGTATKNGGIVNVGLDFKGNVSEARPVEMSQTSSSTTTTTSAQPAMASEPAPAPMPADSMSTTTTTMAQADGATTPHHHRRHHRRHHHGRCANPGPNGAACSGIDRNKNGVSDKEDRALKAGAHP